MLGKILLTLAVIVIAFFFVRQRDMKNKTGSARPKTRTALPNTVEAQEENTLSADLRLGAYMFLVLVIGIGIASVLFSMAGRPFNLDRAPA